LKRYTSASQGTLEFGLNLPRCRATAILKISSSDTLVSVIPRPSSRLPLNVWTSSAIIVSLPFSGNSSRSWYLVGHFTTNDSMSWPAKVYDVWSISTIGFMVVATYASAKWICSSGAHPRQRPVIRLAQPSSPATGRGSHQTSILPLGVTTP
jgi:hypothetical protein